MRVEELNHKHMGLVRGLKRTPRSIFSAERDLLYAMRSYDHKHMIKTVAAFTRGDVYGFILPSASRNLQEFWQFHDNNRDNVGEWTKWIIKQLSGLASALKLLHGNQQSRPPHAHMNLTPWTILCFPPDSDGDYSEVNPATLVIGDASYAKVELGKAANTTGSRYAPPALFESKPQTDMWAMGRIILEFMTWLYHGYNKLLHFQRSTPTGFSFRTGEDLPSPTAAKTHDTIQSHLDHLMRCVQYSTPNSKSFVHKLLVAAANLLTKTPGQEPSYAVPRDQSSRGMTADEFLRWLSEISPG